MRVALFALLALAAHWCWGAVPEVLFAETSSSPKWLSYPKEVIRVNEMACTLTTRQFHVVIRHAEDEQSIQSCPRRPVVAVTNNSFLHVEAVAESVSSVGPNALAIRVLLQYTPQFATEKDQTLQANFSLAVCGFGRAVAATLQYRFVGQAYRNRYGLGPIAGPQSTSSDVQPLSLRTNEVVNLPLYLQNPTTEIVNVIRLEAAGGVKLVAPNSDVKDREVRSVQPGTRSALLARVVISAARPKVVDGFVMIQTQREWLAVRVYAVVAEEHDWEEIPFGILTELTGAINRTVTFKNPFDVPITVKDLFISRFEQTPLSVSAYPDKATSCFELTDVMTPLSVPALATKPIGTLLVVPGVCYQQFPSIEKGAVSLGAMLSAPCEEHLPNAPVFQASYRAVVTFVVGRISPNPFRIVTRHAATGAFAPLPVIARAEDDYYNPPLFELTASTSYDTITHINITQSPPWLRLNAQKTETSRHPSSSIKLGQWEYAVRGIPHTPEFYGYMELKACCRPLFVGGIDVDLTIGLRDQLLIRHTVYTLFVNMPLFLTREFDNRLAPETLPSTVNDPLLPGELDAAPYVHPRQRESFLDREARVTALHLGMVDINLPDGRAAVALPLTLKRLIFRLHNPLNVSVGWSHFWLGPTLHERSPNERQVFIRVRIKDSPQWGATAALVEPGGIVAYELELVAPRPIQYHPEGIVVGNIMFNASHGLGGRKIQREVAIPVSFSLTRGKMVLKNVTFEVLANGSVVGNVTVNSTMIQAFRPVYVAVVRLAAPIMTQYHHRYIHRSFRVLRFEQNAPPNFTEPLAVVEYDPLGLDSLSTSLAPFDDEFTLERMQEKVPRLLSQGRIAGATVLRWQEVAAATQWWANANTPEAARVVIACGPDSSWWVNINAPRAPPRLSAYDVDLGFIPSSGLEPREYYIEVFNPSSRPLLVQLAFVAAFVTDTHQPIPQELKSALTDLLEIQQRAVGRGRAWLESGRLWDAQPFGLRDNGTNPLLIAPHESGFVGPLVYLPGSAGTALVESVVLLRNNLTGFFPIHIVAKEGPSPLFASEPASPGSPIGVVTLNLSATARDESFGWPTLLDILYHLCFRVFASGQSRWTSAVLPWHEASRTVEWASDRYVAASVALTNWDDDVVTITEIRVGWTTCGLRLQQPLIVEPCIGELSPTIAQHHDAVAELQLQPRETLNLSFIASPTFSVPTHPFNRSVTVTFRTRRGEHRNLQFIVLSETARTSPAGPQRTPLLFECLWYWNVMVVAVTVALFYTSFILPLVRTKPVQPEAPTTTTPRPTVTSLDSVPAERPAVRINPMAPKSLLKPKRPVAKDVKAPAKPAEPRLQRPRRKGATPPPVQDSQEGDEDRREDSQQNETTTTIDPLEGLHPSALANEANNDAPPANPDIDAPTADPRASAEVAPHPNFTQAETDGVVVAGADTATPRSPTPTTPADVNVEVHQVGPAMEGPLPGPPSIDSSTPPSTPKTVGGLDGLSTPTPTGGGSNLSRDPQEVALWEAATQNIRPPPLAPIGLGEDPLDLEKAEISEFDLASLLSALRAPEPPEADTDFKSEPQGSAVLGGTCVSEATRRGSEAPASVFGTIGRKGRDEGGAAAAQPTMQTPFYNW